MPTLCAQCKTRTAVDGGCCLHCVMMRERDAYFAELRHELDDQSDLMLGARGTLAFADLR
jgi:hypothetical protein